MPEVKVTHFTDPTCPFAYSAIPAVSVLRWRYGSQLEWELVTIGLSESPERYEANGYTPTRMAVGHLRFRRHGMPLLSLPRERIAASTRACRAIVATRLLFAGREEDVLRALQLSAFTSTLMLDRDEDLAEALAGVPGLDVAAVLGAIDDDATLAAYEEDKRRTRTAEGGPTHFQGKARQTDGPVRFSAPSLIFSDGRRTLEAGGFQPVEAYDVLIANLDPTLERQAAAEDPLEALRHFPDGLVTAEVAAIMAQNNMLPDREAAERALIELAGAGSVRRTPLADDALWQAI
jgi:2-hydroxychromene-2-carboxylate isomerase